MQLPDSSCCPITKDPDTTSAGQMYDRGGVVEAATASWLECFSNTVEEVLEPLQAQLMAVLSQVGKGILMGREFRNLQDVQQVAVDLCRESIGKLEGLSDSFPEEALKAAVWRWDALAESVASFLTNSLHPATAPDMQVSYDMAQRPRTVDIALPASRIANTVLYMVGEFVGRATREAMEEMARAITVDITVEQLAPTGQELVAEHSAEEEVKEKEADVEEEEEEVAAAVPGVAAAPAVARAVVEMNPVESSRSYSSVYKDYDKSCLDSPTRWVPGPFTGSRPGAEWAQLDLGQVLPVVGLVTQGNGRTSWVAQYEVLVSADGATFQPVGSGAFQGNIDGAERATAMFPAAVEARYLRISPTRWRKWPALRWGVFVET